MLQLSLSPDEYLTINGDIVVQLARITGSRAFLRVEADRSIPIVRGKVLERQGAARPECLASVPRAHGRRRKDAVYFWTAGRERAVRVMGQLLDQLEEGSGKETTAALRAKLEQLLPTAWEEELSAQLQALPHREASGEV